MEFPLLIHEIHLHNLFHNNDYSNYDNFLIVPNDEKLNNALIELSSLLEIEKCNHIEMFDNNFYIYALMKICQIVMYLILLFYIPLFSLLIIRS